MSEHLRVERGLLFAHGDTVEVIKVIQNGRTLLAFEFAELDEAEYVGRELLRLAAEWRGNVNSPVNLPASLQQGKFAIAVA